LSIILMAKGVLSAIKRAFLTSAKEPLCEAIHTIPKSIEKHTIR